MDIEAAIIAFPRASARLGGFRPRAWGFVQPVMRCDTGDRAEMEMAINPLGAIGGAPCEVRTYKEMGLAAISGLTGVLFQVPWCVWLVAFLAWERLVEGIIAHSLF